MKKIIVFGGSGFIGSHVSDQLSDKGYDVTVFDVNKSIYLQNSQKFVQGNICNKEDVENAVKGMDIVYHFAAVADIKESIKFPLKTAEMNIIGTINILNACVKFNVNRFIFSSSIYVYSDHGSFYRVSKQSAELFIENFSKEFGLNFTILRYGSLYGTRANEFNFVHNSIKSALTNKKIIRNGDGDEIRDYINVKDAAKLSVNILAKQYINKYLMLTGNQSLKVKDLLSLIKEIFNNDITIEYNKTSINKGHYKITPFSYKPNIALKITPSEFYDLGQGIMECVYEIRSEKK